MPSLNQENRRIIIGILIVIGIAYLFFLSDPPWQTHGSAMTYHSVLGFLAVVATASATNRVIMDPSPSHRAFLAATGFISIVHLGSALLHLIPFGGAIAHTEPKGILVDITEMAILAIMLLIAAYLNSAESREQTFWNKRIATIGLLVVALIVFTCSSFISELPSLSPFIIGGGYVVGIVTIAAFVGSCFFAFKRPEGISSHDKKRLIVSYCLFTLSTAILLLILPSPNNLWLLSVAFQIGALVFIIFGTGCSFLLDVGLQESVAYGFIAVITALAIVPFILAQMAESLLPLVFYENRLLGIILHLSAAVLSVVVGYILTERLKDKTPWYDGPAIFALFSWTIIESVIVSVRLFNPMGIITESMMPYISGGIITSIALVIAIRRALRPPLEGGPKQYRAIRNISYVTVAVFVILIEGTLILLPSLRTQVQSSPHTLASLLIVSFVSMFGVCIFGLLRAAQTGGIYSVEIVGVGSLSLWAVSAILRVNFSVWTTGWWAAELLLFIIFLLLSPLIAGLYIEKYHVERHLNTASKIYTDLMVGEINEHHKLALDSLSEMLRHPSLGEKEMEEISRALNEVSRADDIVDRFEDIVKRKALHIGRTGKIDLHDALQAAFEQIRLIQPEVPTLEMDECSGECQVCGESIVVDLFYSLLKSLLTRIHVESISANIERCENNMWCTLIHLSTGSEIHEHMTNLLSRYLFQVSEGNVEFLLVNEYVRLLKGQVIVGNSQNDRPRDVITVALKLPVAEPDGGSTNP